MNVVIVVIVYNAPFIELCLITCMGIVLLKDNLIMSNEY
jgi:hypothetical protein